MGKSLLCNATHKQWKLSIEGNTNAKFVRSGILIGVSSGSDDPPIHEPNFKKCSFKQFGKLFMTIYFGAFSHLRNLYIRRQLELQVWKLFIWNEYFTFSKSFFNDVLSQIGNIFINVALLHFKLKFVLYIVPLQSTKFSISQKSLRRKHKSALSEE